MNAVIGESRRCEDDALAEQVQPPSKIDVLEVGEEIFVEAAGVEKRRPGEKRGPRAGKQERFFFVRLRSRLTRIALPRVADERGHAAGKIDRLSSPAQNLGCDGRRLVAFRRRDHLPDPIGRDPRIVVEERDELAIAVPNRSVVRRAEPQVSIESHYSRPRIGSPDEFQRTVGGPVIDEDNLKSIPGISLLLEARKARIEMLQSVPIQDEN